MTLLVFVVSPLPLLDKAEIAANVHLPLHITIKILFLYFYLACFPSLLLSLCDRNPPDKVF